MYSLVAQRLKRLPPTRETGARSLGREDSLGKEMATHSSIFCIPEHASVVAVIPPFSDLGAL